MLKVYITSFDILQKNFSTPGLFYFQKGLHDEDFKDEFRKNKSNRYKKWYNKNVPVQKLIEDISEAVGMNQVKKKEKKKGTKSTKIH